MGRLVNDLLEASSEGIAALAEALGALLGGGGIPHAATNGVAQPLVFLYERASAWIERGGEFMGEHSQAAVRALYVGGNAAPERTGGSPVSPPVAPIPAVPATPGGGPAPLAGYSSFFGASGSSADAFQLLFAVVALFSVALLQGGKLSWYSREALGPPSADILPIERPG